MSERGDDDPRIAEILAVLTAYAGGDFSARGEPSRPGDDLAGVVAGVNALGETLAADAQRRHDEGKYRQLAENLPGIAYRVHVGEMRTEFLNQRLAELTGYTATELGNPAPGALTSLIHDDDRTRVADEVNRKAEAGESFVVEYRLRRRDGSYRWMREFGRGVVDRAHRVIHIDGVILDVDETKLLEQELRHTQRMDAIGTLAGGMAHEVNNVLTAVLGLASVLDAEFEESDPRREDTGQIMAAALRGKDLLQNLLGFARKSRGEKQRCSLNEIIRELVAVLTHTLPERISLTTTLAEDLGAVSAEPTSLTQALMNVCLNAADAIAGMGTISITTENHLTGEHLSDSWAGISPGWFACVRVTDTGIGMDEETRQRACEPFFTTKATGRGTGLGLSMVYATISELGGKVEIASREEEGTTLSIYLPSFAAVSDPLVSHGRPRAEVAAAAGGRLLLVDDEAMILRAGKRALERMGHQVDTAEGGGAALEIYRKHRAEIDLVILDVSMPGMSGVGCLTALQALNPDVRVLVWTGHATSDADEMIARGALRIVMKPFKVDDLTAAVSSALAGR